MTIKPFKKPIYVTRPLLPNLNQFHDKLKEIWESQWLSNYGNQHKMLEKKLTLFLKVPYLSLFNNGTTALLVAIKSLNLKGSVITTPFTFPATPHVLSWNNITPIFCDIDPITMNLDTKKIESLITSNTSAILGVHVFGNPCDVKKIQKIADENDLKVIYDAAHAFQVEIDGRGIGTFGDISMFSFHPTKLFNTAEGGALSCNSNETKSQIDLLKNFGIQNEENVILPGINGKMNEIQAAFGLLLLDNIEIERTKRERIHNYYIQSLKDLEGIILPQKYPTIKNSYQYFPIRIKEHIFGKSRDEVYNNFIRYNVYPRKYFYPLCSNYLHYKKLSSSNKDNLPVANEVTDEILCLPFYGNLELREIKKICDIIRSMKRN